MPPVFTAALVYLAVVNLAACAAAIVDKRRARRDEWRIPESAQGRMADSGIHPAAAGGLGRLCVHADYHEAHPAQNPESQVYGGDTGDIGAAAPAGGGVAGPL